VKKGDLEREADGEEVEEDKGREVVLLIDVIDWWYRHGV